jgi:DNA helicase IV
VGRRSELEREQAYVSMLYERLDELRERTRRQLERALQPDGGGHFQARLDRDAFAARHADRLAQLAAAEDGLCFGRLDLGDGSRLYVGRIGLLDDDREALLVDWRAPAAQAFYRATPAAPCGVVRRRHLKTRARVVLDFEDDVLDLDALSDAEREGLAGEAALLAALGASRTGRMTDIVATIQAEQDRVIRSDLPGILVVEGGPGTGKTAVALHRAAYLLYTHRERLARRGVLVVGPNPTFLRYIEQVLPSLGERDVLLSTVEELHPGVAATGREPMEAAAVKGDLRMAGVLAAAVRDRRRMPAAPLEIEVDGATPRLEPETCARARDRALATARPHNQARAIFVREVATALARQVAERMEEDLAAVEVDESLFGPDEQLNDGPLLDEEQLADLRDELLATPTVRAVLDRLWPELTPQRLLADLFQDQKRLAAAAPDLTAAERALLSRPAGAWWTAADVPLLDEAAVLLGTDEEAARRAEARRAEQERRELAYARGVLEVATIGDAARYAPDTSRLDPAMVAGRWRRQGAAGTIAERARQDRTWTFGHVIVDEAQEVSAMAWRMLMRRCPTRSMTVVGDVAQTGAPWGAGSWARALDPHAAGRWRVAGLTVNYRTPAEIMAVAADVLAATAEGLEPPRSVREAGTAPWHLRLDPDELAERLPEVVAGEAAAVGDGKVAVVVPAARAAELGRLLAAALPAATAAQGPAVLDAPVAVLTVPQAKGLEFDAVVVLEPAEILGGSPRGGNDLYVALTRATQRLGVVHGGPLPAALARLRPIAAAQIGGGSSGR